jgi:large conductance mechanosensitive channel
LIIGAGFGKVVASLVSNIIMPPIGMLIGNMDFSALVYELNDKTEIKYGLFITDAIYFVVVAFTVFMVIKQINRLKTAPPQAEPTTKDCPRCFSSISKKATRCPNCTSELGAA